MIVGKCPIIAAGNDRKQSRRETPAEQTYAEGGTALLPLDTENARPAAAPRPGRPDAFFVAQLIATAQQVPQTRPHRRASTADAMSRYNAMTRVASRDKEPGRLGASLIA